MKMPDEMPRTEVKETADSMKYLTEEALAYCIFYIFDDNRKEYSIGINPVEERRALAIDVLRERCTYANTQKMAFHVLEQLYRAVPDRLTNRLAGDALREIYKNGNEQARVMAGEALGYSHFRIVISDMFDGKIRK